MKLRKVLSLLVAVVVIIGALPISTIAAELTEDNGSSGISVMSIAEDEPGIATIAEEAGAEENTVVSSTGVGEASAYNAQVWVVHNGVTYSLNDATDPVTVSDGDIVTVSFEWYIVNNVVDSYGNKVLTYATDLNEIGLSAVDVTTPTALYSGDEYIGTYTIIDGIFTIYLDETATENKSNIGGGAIIQCVIDLDSDDTLANGSEQTVGIVDKSFTVIYDSGSNDSVASIRKSTAGDVQYDDVGEYYYQEYVVEITVDGIMSDASMTDVLPTGLEYIDGTLTVVGDGAVASYDNGTITVTMPDSTTKSYSASYTVTYSAKITDDAMSAGDAIENTATISYTDPIDGPKSEGSTATTTPPSETCIAAIDKDVVGDVAYDSTNGYFYQDYTITVSVDGRVSDISIVDALPDDETLVSGSVTIKTAAGDEVTDATVDESTFTITLPDHSPVDDATEYIITYRAIISDEAVILGSSLKNTATLTYSDPKGNTHTDNDTETVTTKPVTIDKEGVDLGLAVNSWETFQWTVTIDFGTYGISLSESDINEILATMWDTAFYNGDESLSLSRYKAPIDLDAQTDLIAAILYYCDPNASNSHNYGYITLDELTANADGTYSLEFCMSYYLSVINATISTISNEIGIYIGTISIFDIATVELEETDIGDISLDKSSSLVYGNTTSFTEGYVTYSDTVVDYDVANQFKKITITVTTPYEVPTSNIDVNITLDDGLTFAPSVGVSATKNGSTLSVAGPNQLANRANYSILQFQDQYCTFYYDTDFKSLVASFYGEPNTTYTITFYASIDNYVAGNDYSSLGETISVDYDLELPYTLTVDLTGLDTSSTTSMVLQQSISNGELELIISDEIKSGTSYFIDWNQSQSLTITMSNLSYIVNSSTTVKDTSGVYYSDSKYDSVREFIRNFSITMCGYEYPLWQGTSGMLATLLTNSSLTVTRYSWTLNISSSSMLYGYILDNYFKYPTNSKYNQFIVNYNAVQDPDILASSSSISYYNTADAILTYKGGSTSDDDYQSLSTTNTNYFTVYKTYRDSTTLGDTTYTYTDDNHIGWSIRMAGANYLQAGTTLVITDTLPEHLTYTEGSYIAYVCGTLSSTVNAGSFKNLSDYATIVESYDSSTRTITYTITMTAKPSYTYMFICFQSEIETDYYTTMCNIGARYSFTNNVTVTKNGTPYTSSGTKYITTTVSDPITKELLSVVKDETKYDIIASYSIEVNPNEGEYNTSSDTLDIIDTLPDCFVLNESSVAAVDGSGNAVSITTVYDTAENVATFTIPDNTYVTITYSVTIGVNALSDPTWYTDSTNTAKISGGIYNNKSSSISITSADYDVSVWAYEADGSVTIYKYWEDSGIDTDLAGATFSIYTVYDNNGKWYASGDSGYMAGTVKTDSDGAATFSGLALDRIYKVVEINAPDGFLTADEFYVVLQGYDGVDIPDEIKNSGLRVVEVAFSNDSEPIEILDEECVDITVTKVWDDDDNREGLRPDEVTVSLLANGEVYDTVTLTEADGWEYTWDGVLPKYDDSGVEIIYTVAEVDGDNISTVPTDYDATVNGYEITNTHEIETTEIKVTKTWDDDDNRDGIRPASITVTLTGSDGNTYTADLTKDNNWEYTFTDLPVYWNEGTTIEYTLNEVAVEGYTVTEDDFALTNTHEIETTEIKVTKTWDDDDNRDGIRPETITVTLTGSDGNTYTADLTKDNNWEYTFTDLPVYWNEGTAIEYTLNEVAVEGYTVIEDDFALTNTHEIETTEIKVTKTWDDDDNRDGIRPTSITVTLTGSDGNTYTADLTKDNNWEYTFTDLPVYWNEGTAIEYTLNEVAVEGYTVTKDDFALTNTHEIETTEIKVTKTWDDDDNRDGIRPETITVTLTGSDGNTYTADLTKDNNWEYTFTDLPVYWNEGTTIEYTLNEVAVEGYTVAESDFALTNTHEIETTEIKVTKTWDDDDNRDGIRPETITVTLTGSDGNTYTADLTKDNNWEYTFTDLPVYWNEGTAIEYTLEESEIEEYTGEITAVDGGFEVTNTHAPYTTEVSVTKVWDDAGNYDYIRPTSITVVLLGDGAEVETAELNEDNGWAYTFTDLYVNSEGEPITYTVEEVSVSGYTSEITGDAESGYVVTNTHTPDFSPSLSYTSVTVTKVWNDDNDSDGVRPASVTVVLYQDGVATGRSVTLSADNNWTASFTGLLATNGNTVYTYSVGEANVPENYTATVSGNGYSFTITNTYTPVVEIEEPIESTDTDDEPDTDDLEVQEEPETTDSNPTTGIVLSLLPMAVIALAAVSVKRR